MKIVTRKDKGFVYEHEMTRNRRFWNVVENVVNHLLIITFGVMILSGVVIAVINLV